MDLFRVERVSTDFAYEVSFACSLNDHLYVCSKNGGIYKYKIFKDGEGVSVEFRFVGEYTVRRNKEVSKMVIVEREEGTNFILLLTDEQLYIVKNDIFGNASLICKNVITFTVNEFNKLEIVVYGKKKKLLFLRYDMNSSCYKLYKEIHNTESISSFLLVRKSLFISIDKNYYLQNVQNNEKILLYSHEFEQTYKNITLVNMDEVFIVCDLNIGVFYDVDTSMPSRKNTITLPDNIQNITSFRFFLCCINGKGVLSIYNTNNQQHVQTVFLDEYMIAVVNYTDVSSALLALFDSPNGEEVPGVNTTVDGVSGMDGVDDMDSVDHMDEEHLALLNFDEEGIEESRKRRQERLARLEKMEKRGGLEEEEKEVTLKLLANADTCDNHLKNNIYFINKQYIQIVRCLELFKYLPKCIDQNKVDTGFLLIQNYNFESDEEKMSTLHEYNKACGYHYFTNLNFALAFLHFEKVQVNTYFLLSFWKKYLTPNATQQEITAQGEQSDKSQPSRVSNSTLGNVTAGGAGQNIVGMKSLAQEENIHKQFKQFVPKMCSIQELIERGYRRYLSDRRYLLREGRENTSHAVTTPDGQEEETKGKILYTANNCLIRYLLGKRKQKGGHDGEHLADLYASPEADGIDTILLKLLVENRNVGYHDFVMNTPDLNLNVWECVQFLRERGKFSETILLYIRMHHFDKAIKMCSLFLRYYNSRHSQSEGKLFEKDVFNRSDIERDNVQFDEDQLFWINILKGKKRKNDILNDHIDDNGGNTSLHVIFGEIYNIFIILNKNVHILNIEKSYVKSLFKNAFPFLIKHNERLFFDLILNKSSLLCPEEILATFKNLEEEHNSIKIKQYLQKYVINYLKYDKHNEYVNTALIEFYMNDSEKPVHVRQKYILQFLRSNNPVNIDRLIRITEGGKFDLLRALLFGKLHRHYDSLEILVDESLRACEKYCHYYNLMLKDRIKSLSKEKYENLFAGIYSNEKGIYRDIFEDVHDKGMEMRESSSVFPLKKKKKKCKNSLVSDIMNDFHKYNYITMNKRTLRKIKTNERKQTGRKENWMVREGEEEANMEKRKQEYHYMLHLIEEEENDVINDDLTDCIGEPGASGESDESDENCDIGKSDECSKSVEGESVGDKCAQRQSKHRNKDVDMFTHFHVYKYNQTRSCGFFFLFVKVCMDRYNNVTVKDEKKERYKKYILYTLNKYANHNDLDNAYIFEIIPKEWKITEIANYLNFTLRKKLNTHLNMHIYHNLLKSIFLGHSFDLIQQKERKILVRDKLICSVCNEAIVERKFAYFSEEAVVHMRCVEKYDESAHA
ncbi:vacuolar protein sorting-associated protein 3, putative (VPS3) [Plasmodium ovale curtisi]|uniref:Vacuolar protein sorting-associated protein 3, putative (VPS3) n=1 Tax=Plasmodium ovale curtisi TaxID=864141 RepID=A0A1A8WYZ8_PLAOA|nr:vacuolar protein sorting-associated protein 3, putative (VPS3) [Plasmodium ovale curtisi]